MLALSLVSLFPQISHLFWPFLRILALFSSAPLFSEKQISKKVKIGLALILSALIAPQLPDNSVAIYSFSGLWCGAQQLLIGTAIGLSAQLIFVAVRHAGEIIGLQMGLSFATFYDPSGGQNMPVVARLLNLLVTMLFLIFNGHLYMIEVVAESFKTLPIGVSLMGAAGFYTLVAGAGMVFKFGLMLGLPVIALLLCLNLTLGIINRLLPQLSVFVIGFPLSLSVGMLALSLIMYTLSPFFSHLLAGCFDGLRDVFAGFQSRN
ncbi:Flagellar biosynthetic protein MopE [Enterobacter sp. DC4]|uniref:flagellar biosynthetic protein FliR n=1 Tax=Enterobacter sp. DC4 TaxID=1395580 RepID=UPI0003ECFFC5|nr:flagellar biosynthetic protein FliR [Enterobacter sp. DC4]EWG67273.1 Flagellar biosynthetic protein MopE [Enterobacter sp. DC4]